MFNELDSTGIAIIAFIALIINLWILYSIIRSATQSKTIVNLQRMQVELLKQMAFKSGVSNEAIEAIVKSNNEYSLQGEFSQKVNI